MTKCHVVAEVKDEVIGVSRWLSPFYSSSTLFKTDNLSDQLPSCKISIILTFRKLLFNNNNFNYYFEV